MIFITIGEKSISSDVYSNRKEGKAIRTSTNPGKKVQMISNSWFSVSFNISFLLFINRIDM
jgi:hypothetical protein